MRRCAPCASTSRPSASASTHPTVVHPGSLIHHIYLESGFCLEEAAPLPKTFFTDVAVAEVIFLGLSYLAPRRRIYVKQFVPNCPPPSQPRAPMSAVMGLVPPPSVQHSATQVWENLLQCCFFAYTDWLALLRVGRTMLTSSCELQHFLMIHVVERRLLIAEDELVAEGLSPRDAYRPVAHAGKRFWHSLQAKARHAAGGLPQVGSAVSHHAHGNPTLVAYCLLYIGADIADIGTKVCMTFEQRMDKLRS